MPEVYYADKNTPKVQTNTEKISVLSYQNDITDNKIRLYQNKFETTPTWQNLTEQQTDEKQKLIEQKIKLYEKIINQTKLDLIKLQKEKDNWNNLTIAKIDSFISLFSDNTPSKIYANTFEITKNQAKNILPKVEELLKDKNLTQSEKTRLENVKNEIQIILKSNIKDTSLLTLTKNEILFMPEKIKLAAYWVKGEVIGVIDWAKNIITWFADLVVWIWKYAVYKEYREKINTQISQIYDFCVENWFTWMKDVVVNAINTEIDRISKLPKEKQAEEIWKIAWNVIAIIWTFKVWAMVSNKLKVIPAVWETATLWEKIKTWTIITWLNTANVVINWPEEYLLKWAWKWIGMISDRISELVKTKWLSNITRIDLAESILWWIKLNKNQIDAIELAHKTENLLQKVKILKEAWFDEIQRDLLIRNYVCWWEISDILKSINKYSIDYKYAEINELEKSLNISKNKLNDIDKKLNNAYDNILKLANNPKLFSSDAWRNLIKDTLNNIRNNINDEKSIKKLEEIVKVLEKWVNTANTTPEKKLFAKQLVEEFEKLKIEIVEKTKQKDIILKTTNELNLSKKYIWEFEDFYKKLEKIDRNDLLIWDFQRNIDEFNGQFWTEIKNWKKVNKEPKPELLKERIKVEIEKFEIWQNYRKEKFNHTEKNITDDKKDFIESISSSINFQYWNKIEFKTFEEINLFFKKN